MFTSTEAGYGQGAFAASLSLADAITTPLRQHEAPGLIDRVRDRIADLDLVPDLGQDIGSARWLRGLATLATLCAIAFLLLPAFAPLSGAQAPMPSAREAEELRAQMIMPLALGADSGRRMAATDAVRALKAAPERPRIALTATLGRGDGFARLLQRAGVGGAEAAQVAGMVGDAVAIGDIAPGTKVDIVLGRRSSRTEARPLESIDFRARLDLALSIARSGAGLVLNRKPIAVDDTPLRIRGSASGGIFRAARAAGAPAEAVEKYLRVIAQQTPVSGVGAGDTFDMVVGYRRAATGEVEVGDLIYAGLEKAGGKPVRMLRWKDAEGDTRWFEASGVGENRGEFARPVPGMVTSSYGMRFHPILGYARMHKGMDFRASYGQPIFATADGVVSFSGRKGGYGNFVELRHAGGLASGYGHMSRIAASYGARVRRGQIIGYVGSTGLSTGPHLHYELYRNGVPVNPNAVKYTTRAQLSGRELARFRDELARLQKVKPGAALSPLRNAALRAGPKREIEKIAGADLKLKAGDQVFRP